MLHAACCMLHGLHCGSDFAAVGPSDSVLSSMSRLPRRPILCCRCMQALQGGVLSAAMLEHLTSEQSEWVLAHLASLSSSGGSKADDGSSSRGGGDNATADGAGLTGSGNAEDGGSSGGGAAVDDASSGSARRESLISGGSPVVVAPAAVPLADQHAALTDFLVGATASGEQLSAQHYGCLSAFGEVSSSRNTTPAHGHAYFIVLGEESCTTSDCAVSRMHGLLQISCQSTCMFWLT